MQYRIIVILVLLFLTGCSRGFDRGRLSQTLRDAPLQINDATIAAQKKIRPQIKSPFRLAIYLAPSDRPYSWRWTADDKKRIDVWGVELMKSGIVKDVFIMSEMFAEGWTLLDHRRAAARHGADALLVLQAATDIDSYANPSALLYLTVVGAFIVPGTHRDALFMLQGGLIDVNNGYLYATAESEAEHKSVMPAYFIEDEDAVNPAKEEALEAFGDEIIRRIKNLS